MSSFAPGRGLVPAPTSGVWRAGGARVPVLSHGKDTASSCSPLSLPFSSSLWRSGRPSLEARRHQRRKPEVRGETHMETDEASADRRDQPANHARGPARERLPPRPALGRVKSQWTSAASRQSRSRNRWPGHSWDSDLQKPGDMSDGLLLYGAGSGGGLRCGVR